MKTVLPDSPRHRPWLLPGLMVGAAVAIALGSQPLLRSMVAQPRATELPVRSQISGDLVAVERSGRSVAFSELRGKVIVAACIYTVCPHGCSAVVGEMQKLHDEWGRRDDFQLVSLAVRPDHDTPAFLQSFAEGLGLESTAHWWFLTGERENLVGFMSHELKLTPPVFLPEEVRLNPDDLYEHDLRVVLIDRLGRIRGYYSVFHPQGEIALLMRTRLQQDVRTLMESR